jgi:hypothetical protein
MDTTRFEELPVLSGARDIPSRHPSRLDRRSSGGTLFIDFAAVETFNSIASGDMMFETFVTA